MNDSCRSAREFAIEDARAEPPRDELAKHLRECKACAEFSLTIRRHAHWVASCAAVESPRELHDPGFLSGVYARAVTTSEIAPSLTEALQPIDPPVSIDWAPRVLADLERSRAATLLSDVRAPVVPGWLWSRVRARLSIAPPAVAGRAIRAWLPHRRAAVIAAAVVMALSLTWLFAPIRTGNSPSARIVFVHTQEPLLPGLSHSAILRGEQRG